VLLGLIFDYTLTHRQRAVLTNSFRIWRNFARDVKLHGALCHQTGWSRLRWQIALGVLQPWSSTREELVLGLMLAVCSVLTGRVHEVEARLGGILGECSSDVVRSSLPVTLRRHALYLSDCTQNCDLFTLYKKLTRGGGSEASFSQTSPQRGSKQSWDRPALEALVQGRFHLSRHSNDEVPFCQPACLSPVLHTRLNVD
jgi:hypothetical protein